MSMTTESLLAFCALPDNATTREYVEARRGILEKMEQVCAWDAGVAPLPDGVLTDSVMPAVWPKRGAFSDSMGEG